jgi:anti-anti-sigma factor
MSFKLQISQHGSDPLVRVEGKLTSKEADLFSATVISEAPWGCKKIIIDMNAIELMDSHGIGALIHVWQTLKARNCNIILYTAHPQIRDLLKHTRLDKAFTVVNTPDELSGVA